MNSASLSSWVRLENILLKVLGHPKTCDERCLSNLAPPSPPRETWGSAPAVSSPGYLHAAFLIILPAHRKWLTTGKIMSMSVAQYHHGLAMVDWAELKQLLNETELKYES